jgi:hypothetical protein
MVQIKDRPAEENWESVFFKDVEIGRIFEIDGSWIKKNEDTAKGLRCGAVATFRPYVIVYIPREE